jgi:hypothetical protein
MKKLFVHLTMLALLAALLVPMVGCKKEETDVEETPATSAMEEPATTSAEPMATDMGTDMGTSMGTSEPMGTEMTPPAQ